MKVYLGLNCSIIMIIVRERSIWNTDFFKHQYFATYAFLSLLLPLVRIINMELDVFIGFSIGKRKPMQALNCTIGYVLIIPIPMNIIIYWVAHSKQLQNIVYTSNTMSSLFEICLGRSFSKRLIMRMLVVIFYAERA